MIGLAKCDAALFCIWQKPIVRINTKNIVEVIFL
jgi:hypothetical protein